MSTLNNFDFTLKLNFGNNIKRILLEIYKISLCLLHMYICKYIIILLKTLNELIKTKKTSTFKKYLEYYYLIKNITNLYKKYYYYYYSFYLYYILLIIISIFFTKIKKKNQVGSNQKFYFLF